jgi:hypothetical protein
VQARERLSAVNKKDLLTLKWLQNTVKTGNVACVSRATGLLFSSIRFAALAALAALPATRAYAVDGSASVTGSDIVFYGATSTNWVNGSELILTFESEGSFILPGQTKARILAVGGGGGGGGV